jgi:hypothetical protein
MFETLKQRARRDTTLAREMDRDVAAQVLLVISECEWLAERVRALECKLAEKEKDDPHHLGVPGPSYPGSSP